ncbi:MAG: hypothetical protein GXP62_06400 [Oligoflexia bacterium]|nr:hypothetical protein [Oligoflexia bacterium]
MDWRPRGAHPDEGCGQPLAGVCGAEIQAGTAILETELDPGTWATRRPSSQWLPRMRQKETMPVP